MLLAILHKLLVLTGSIKLQLTQRFGYGINIQKLVLDLCQGVGCHFFSRR